MENNRKQLSSQEGKELSAEKEAQLLNTTQILFNFVKAKLQKYKPLKVEITFLEEKLLRKAKNLYKKGTRFNKYEDILAIMSKRQREDEASDFQCFLDMYQDILKSMKNGEAEPISDVYFEKLFLQYMYEKLEIEKLPTEEQELSLKALNYAIAFMSGYYASAENTANAKNNLMYEKNLQHIKEMDSFYKKAVKENGLDNFGSKILFMTANKNLEENYLDLLKPIQTPEALLKFLEEKGDLLSSANERATLFRAWLSLHPEFELLQPYSNFLDFNTNG